MTNGIEREKNIFYAKSANEKHAAVTNREHLSRVSSLAAEFGESVGMADAARVAGLLHDTGKYSRRFSDVLCGKAHNVDHAFPSGELLYAMLGEGKIEISDIYKSVIEAVVGHHDWLVPFGSIKGELSALRTKPDACSCPSGKTPSLSGNDEFNRAAVAFKRDFPTFKLCLSDKSAVYSGEGLLNDIAYMLTTRMLFSCLVDADYSVSASDDEPDYLENNSGGPIDYDEALKRLDRYRSELSGTSRAAARVNQLRERVFEACGDGACDEMGFFTLSAPTGVGKTLAMLNFALRHCRHHHLRRIIVVLPFLTLAEQLEREYRKIFDTLLVDHSQSELNEQTRELASRWDAPVVITTSVRFFEGLFSDRPTVCRRLHNIADSVVLFDEAQSLPAELAAVSVGAMRVLCERFHCSILLSTATQPNFSALKDVSYSARELLCDNENIFSSMARVNVEWRVCLNADIDSAPTLDDIAEELSGESNVCCIVNLRRHARTLVKKLIELVGEDGVYLLSTELCPAHRLSIVDEIRERQAAGKVCRVISTQCIEAGVDLDFDSMYRALAPLESIVQAAGRCNRNGRLEGGGKTVVFEPRCDGGVLYPSESYKRAALVVKLMLADKGEIDINSPDSVEDYYGKLFSNVECKPKLAKAIKEDSYGDVAASYRIVDSDGYSLIVPWSGRRELFDRVCDAVDSGSVTRKLFAEAAPITVSCFDKRFESFAQPIRLRRHGEAFDSGYYIINRGFENKYDEKLGLICDAEENVIFC